MQTKQIIPNGWPCTLQEAPPGPFVSMSHPDLLCFKSEYTHADKEHPNDNRVMAFNSAGEFFCSGNDTMVQPVEMIVTDEES